MSLLGFDAIGRLALGQDPGSPTVFGGQFGIWPAASYPKNFARDWIAFSGDYYVETKVLSFFTGFSQQLKPPSLAKDWTAYSGNIFIEKFPLTGIDFLPFSLGVAVKLWSGQGPQWWPYHFKVPVRPPKRRDTHDGDWIPRHHHPAVYSQEYYDRLRKKIELDDDGDEVIEEIKRVPNLLIPLTKLLAPVNIPSLVQSPPFRPVPSLTTNPPPFRMATHDEMTADDEMIIRMLLEE